MPKAENKPTSKRVGAVRKSSAAGKKPLTKKSATRAAKSPAKAARVSVVATSDEKPGHGLDLVRRCVRALENKKAAQIEVIRVAETSSVTDFYIIATGTSDPHLRALRVELEKVIDEVVPAGGVRIQNEPNSGWCVVDAFDVVVHIFSAEKREFYNLEELYAAGEKIVI